ncbi:MAG: leucine-rich repeat protein [Eubacterium sp.]|nr:leucine-rich repeat protein [Eubacterium sp.]
MRKMSIRMLAFVLSIIISFTMLSGMGSVGNVSAASSYKDNIVGTIKFNGSINVKIESDNSIKYVEFKPDTTDYYQFYTEQDANTYLAGYKEVTDTSGKSSISSFGSTSTVTSENGYSNRKLTGYFYSGTTYYIAVKFNDLFCRGGNITLYCMHEYKDISNFSVRDISPYEYTGSPIDVSNIEFYSSYTNSAGDKVMLELKYGTDWKVFGYCSLNTYSMSSYVSKNSIAWKNGFPKEKGIYTLWIKGVGAYRGNVYKTVYIFSKIDPEYIITEEMTSSEKKINVTRLSARYVTLRPSTTGSYSIESSTKYNYDDYYYSGLYTYGVLYNKLGNKIGTYYDEYGIDRKAEKNHYNYSYGSEEYKAQEQYYQDHRYQFRITAELKAGEVYYLRVLTDDSYSAYNSETNAYETVYPDSTDVTLKIPGYVYKAPASDKPASDGKKTDNTDKKKDTKKVQALAKGKTFVSGKIKYKVTESKKGSYKVAVVKNQNKNLKNAVIADSVQYKGITYKITSIGAKAFANSKKLTTVKIGKNVTSIGAGAFSGCSKVTKITVAGTVIKSVKANAFKGIGRKAVVVVPKKALKKYKKLFKGMTVKTSAKSKTK